MTTQDEQFTPPPKDAVWVIEHPDGRTDFQLAHTAMAAHACSALKTEPFSSVIVSRSSPFDAQAHAAALQQQAALVGSLKDAGEHLLTPDEIIMPATESHTAEIPRTQGLLQKAVEENNPRVPAASRYPNSQHFKELSLELKVMGLVNEALVPLTPEAALRVLEWATSRYNEFKRQQTLQGIAPK